MKGLSLASFDDDGELTFRVEYEDDDYEDLAEEEEDVRATLIKMCVVSLD